MLEPFIGPIIIVLKVVIIVLKVVIIVLIIK